MESQTYLRIPRRFFDDHEERALPTPIVVRTTAAHYFIAADDKALDELISDAKHYAYPALDCPWLVAPARALLRALGVQFNTERKS